MMDYNRINWKALFDKLYPGFFEQSSIHSLPADGVWDEMAMALAGFSPDAVSIPVPEGITFDFYRGDMDALRRAVGRVDASWPSLFTPDARVYCAFDKDAVASFCMLESMGEYEGLRVGGPGCVGTLPEYRRKGIGLKMVWNATSILAREGFDLSFIHYTGVAAWYARLGYRTVLRWNGRGPIDMDL